MPAAKQNNAPTALLGAITGLIVVLGLKVGIHVDPELAAAAVLVPALIVSYLNPRWASAHGVFVKRPAAWAGALTTLLVFLAPLADVQLDSQEAAAIVAAVIGIVGGLTPIGTKPASAGI